MVRESARNEVAGNSTVRPEPGSLPATGRLRGRPHVLLTMLAYAALTLVLLFSTPPGGSPDETAHYLKALAAGRGDWVLTKPPAPLPPDPTISPRIRFLHLQTRMVSIPDRLSPEPFSCWADPFYLGDCTRQAPSSGAPTEIGTYVGRYPPYSYVLPGILMHLGNAPKAALLWGRVGMALPALAMIVLAAVLLANQSPLSLTGLMAAITPMVVWLLASLSSNGVEIAAGISFFACLMRLSRPGSPPKWVWIATAISGSALALVRDLGPLWLLVDLLIVACLGMSREKLRLAGKPAAVAAIAIGCSAILGFAWQVTQAARPPSLGFGLIADLPGRFEYLPDLYRQSIGIFGPLDAPMNAPTYWTAGLLILGLVMVAMFVGTNRERIALAVTAVALLVLTLAVDAAQALSGFGAQARHILPVAVALPLIAGEIVYRHSGSLGRRLRRVLPLVVAAAASAVQMIGWFTIARRFSVGPTGPLMFFRHPAWSPPLGWASWATLTFVGALLLVCAALVRGSAIAAGGKR